ncbi:winged helix-turn-helix domain-containing protein [Pseudoalteromonas piratica]|uniref:OmpR/PhoB-type domain-containing protein n=1 Tax=Pseudoalteromonas piratica TaxID=1348114 RepID=A0A0A7EKY6_9GAMM|nr:winged helix-turn-helix domain-containing protein [Pseudoalteromonas piratica]AIY67193.1 hypothetical protein OM33_19210 [Pseudoalteromonas piratica]
MPHISLPNSLIKIDKIVVDFVAMRVKRKGVWCKIESKQLKLLEVLISYQGRAVSRDELLDSIWPNVIVSDNSLSKLVTELRKTIGDDRKEQGIIRTVPRIGYQLIAPISENVIDDKPINSKNAFYLAALCLLLGVVTHYFIAKINTNAPLSSRYKSRLLTQRAGIEQGMSFSSDGAFMVFNYTPINQSHSDLAVMDLKQQTSHILKNANYSEQAGVFSPDQKWLAYIRSDALQCNIRVVSTASAIETWRLSLDSKLANCPSSLINVALSWPQHNVIIAQFNNQLFRYDVSFEPFPRALEDGKKLIDNVDDFTINKQSLYTLSRNENVIYQHDLFGQDKTALSIQEPNMTHIASANEDLWVGASKLIQYKTNERLGELTLPLGKIYDMSVNPKTQAVTVSAANAEIGLFKVNSDLLKPLSSSMTDALLPTVSADGSKYAYLTIDKPTNQQQIWLRHFNNINVQYVTSFSEQALPDIMSFSPNGNFLIIGFLDKKLVLVNLVTKHSVTIATGKFDKLHWHPNNLGIFYVKEGEKTSQNWFYNLSMGIAEPNAQTRDIEFMLANKEYRSVLTNGYRNYAESIGKYLSERIYDPLLIDNVMPSTKLFTPSIYQSGIYFAVKKGKTVTLYDYRFDTGEYSEMTALAVNAFHTTLPLTITSDSVGKQVVVNQVNNLQSDLVILEKK